MREFHNRLNFKFGQAVPYLIEWDNRLSATVFRFLRFIRKKYSLFCKIFVPIIAVHFSVRRTSTQSFRQLGKYNCIYREQTQFTYLHQFYIWVKPHIFYHVPSATIILVYFSWGHEITVVIALNSCDGCGVIVLAVIF